MRQGLSTSGVAGFFAAGEIGPVGDRNHLHGFSASVLGLRVAASRIMTGGVMNDGIMTDGSVLAIDIGGTKMAVGIVAADGRVMTSSRTPTPPGR